MALVLADRVQQTGTANTTVSFTLSGSVTGFQSFAVIGNTNTTYYAATDASGNWEVGIGTYSTTGPTLTRTTILSSSNAGSAETFSGTVTVFVTYPSGKSVNYEQTGGVVITDNNTNNALRITQTGTGNALLIEDSANPDSSPIVVDQSGIMVLGDTASLSANLATGSAKVQISGGTAPLALYRNADSSTAINLEFAKRRATGGVLVSGDVIGRLYFSGNDGTAAIPAAYIDAAVDGTPGTNDMPGRLVFSTTADGASTPTERMRIDSSGAVGIGATSLTGYVLRLGRNIFGATTSYGILNQGTIQPTVTGSGVMQATSVLTAANGGTPYTIANILHYQASQGTFNADSTVTNQYGFTVTSNLIGATNNYGFHSAIASGTGRYNFYAAGTASNFFGGNTIVEVTDNTNAALRITQLGTGNALVVEDSTNPDSTPFVVDASGNVVVGYTSAITGTGPATATTPTAQIHGTTNNKSSIGLYNWSSTGSLVDTLSFNRSLSNTIGTFGGTVTSGVDLGAISFSGDDGTSFIEGARIIAEVDGTPGTNDMPGRLVFSTTADGAATPTERLRIDSAGDIDMAATSSLQKNSINAYTLKNITYLTSGTAATYTTPTGVRALKVTTIGGGGGGGGVNGSSTASTNAYSDGGGGGGYATAFIATAEASYTYTVGSGGTGGAVGANAGATGGTTEFKNAGATIIVSATGGAGGLGDTGATSTGATTGAPGVGSITGLGTPGGVIGSGTGIFANGYGRYINGTAYSLAGSGYCPLIGGGVESATGATGINATRYGEGGGNIRTATAVATDYAGGNGFAGLIIVEEYY